jgi:hypothetical protein
LSLIAVALVLLLVGALVGFFIARSQSADEAAELDRTREELGILQRALTQTEERNWNYYLQYEALRRDLDRYLSGGGSSTSTTLPRPYGPGATYGDGVYLVGEDIAVGTYDGVVTDEIGYWARLKGTDGTVNSIITNDIPRGPFLLTIITSDKAVELRGVVITAR